MTGAACTLLPTAEETRRAATRARARPTARRTRCCRRRWCRAPAIRACCQCRNPSTISTAVTPESVGEGTSAGGGHAVGMCPWDPVRMAAVQRILLKITSAGPRRARPPDDPARPPRLSASLASVIPAPQAPPGPLLSALGGTRTPDLLVRSEMLYPIELRALGEANGECRRSWSVRQRPIPIASPSLGRGSARRPPRAQRYVGQSSATMNQVAMSSVASAGR